MYIFKQYFLKVDQSFNRGFLRIFLKTFVDSKELIVDFLRKSLEEIRAANADFQGIFLKDSQCCNRISHNVLKVYGNVIFIFFPFVLALPDINFFPFVHITVKVHSLWYITTIGKHFENFIS